MKKLQAKVEIKKIGEKITVVASDETLDRHGEVLPIESWDITRFLQAPRMLVDHDHRVEKIVGRWENVRIENNQLLMEPVFHDFTDLAKAVEEMVNADPAFLNTVSVGFIPHGPVEDGGTETFELIETSWVTVPANHNARVVKALEEQVSDDQKKQIDTFAGENNVDKTLKELLAERPEIEVIKSVEMYHEYIKEFPEDTLLLCEAPFISNLISDSEKLKTLIEEHKQLKLVVASKDKQHHKMMVLALKEVAKTVSDALRKSKVTK